MFFFGPSRTPVHFLSSFNVKQLAISVFKLGHTWQCSSYKERKKVWNNKINANNNNKKKFLP